MSVKIMSKIWETSKESGGNLLVLLALADWSDERGISWYSIKNIGIKSRLSERQVQRVLAHLVEINAVQIVRQSNGFPGSTNVYRVLTGDILSEMGDISGKLPMTFESLTGDAHVVRDSKKDIKKKKDIEEALPLPFSSEEFIETWKEWEQYRKEKKFPLTNLARKIQFKKAIGMGEKETIHSIYDSISSGYRDFFAPKTIGGVSSSKPYTPTTHHSKVPQKRTWEHWMTDLQLVQEYIVRSIRENGTLVSPDPHVKGTLDRAYQFGTDVDGFLRSLSLSEEVKAVFNQHGAKI